MSNDFRSAGYIMIYDISHDISFLLHQMSVVLQRFNAIFIRESFPDADEEEEPDLRPLLLVLILLCLY